MPDSQVIASLGGAKNPILVTLSEIEGARVVDIRRYFVDKATGELRPTQKGISVQAANFAELFACLSDAHGHITSWLDGNGASDRVRRSGAAIKAAAKGGRPTLKMEAWRGASFFMVDSLGAQVDVALKEDHPFSAALRSVSTSDAAGQLVADLLATYQTAITSASVDEEAQIVALPQLEAAWGNQLSTMLKNRKER